MELVYLAIPLSALIGSMIAGFLGGVIGRKASHTATLAGVGIAFLLSLYVFQYIALGGNTYNDSVYTWMEFGKIKFEVGFLIDNLTSMMMVVVTFVSLMVHIYTIGYMSDDEHNWPKNSKAGNNNYQRFFSYISLFTF